MKKADEILKGLLSTYNMESGKTYSSFFQSWSVIAGPDAAAHSRIQEIEGSMLLVEVDHPGWIQIIQMNKASILKKTKSMYPDLNIKEMKIFLKK